MEKDEKPSFASIQENAEPRSQIVATLLQFRSLIAEKKDFSTRQTVHKTANPSTITRTFFFQIQLSKQSTFAQWRYYIGFFSQK